MKVNWLRMRSANAELAYSCVSVQLQMCPSKLLPNGNFMRAQTIKN